MAFIAAFTSYIFLSIVDLPYAIALAVSSAARPDPAGGATIAAVIVSLLGFTQSVGVGLACVDVLRRLPAVRERRGLPARDPSRGRRAGAGHGLAYCSAARCWASSAR